MKNEVLAWILLVLFLTAGIIVQCGHSVLKLYLDLTLYSICLFFFLTIVVQLLAPKLARHSNRQLFLAATVYHTVIKMVFSAILLYWYHTSKNPTTGSFVLPFLYIYLVFTTFETRFLMKASYMNSKMHLK
ncbi:MAG: hypothetical protein LW630_09055 [Saprospiraceae bacterium]|jgi:hypothetical protein|nr:hypothetical protein [Saprospiraceae bacterium]